jgi:hypothetical protein
MKHRMIIAVFIIPILLLTSACNLPLAVPQTGMPPSDKLNPLVAPASTATDTATPPPSPSPSLTLTPTPARPVLWVATDTNCRSSPGKVYDWVGGLQVGEKAEIFARDPRNEYFYISNPDNIGTFCWVWGFYATPSGDTGGLPVFTPPPTPTPPPTDTPTAIIFRVTSVTASADRTSYSGTCPFTLTWSGKITTNGAGTVKYEWEHADVGGFRPASVETLVFTSAGTKNTVDQVLQPLVSLTFKARIHVIEPNEVYSSVVPVSVTCTP